ILGLVLSTNGISATPRAISIFPSENVGIPAAAADLSNGTTGTGAVVLATSPTITTPTISNPTISNPTITGTPTGSATTGTGNVVLANSPTITTPTLSGALGGNLDLGAANATLFEIANAGTTGTTVNKLAKLTGAPSTVVIAAITDAKGI